MKKSFLIFDTLSKSLVSLRFLDKGSKRLIKILGFQFVFGSLIESFALTFIYKLFNLIFLDLQILEIIQKYNLNSIILFLCHLMI